MMNLNLPSGRTFCCRRQHVWKSTGFSEVRSRPKTIKGTIALIMLVLILALVPDATERNQAGAQETAPGEVLCIPRGVVHRFDNDHELDAKMLAIVSPGMLGADYFRKMAAVIEAATGGPPDPAALAEVMRRHGLTPAP